MMLITDTTLGVMSEKHIEDYWNFGGERELSDAWTGFTRFSLSNEKPLDGNTWSVGRRLTRKQTSRSNNVRPNMRKHMSDASKRKDKQKWTIEKPKLDNVRRLRGIYFIDFEDEEFMDIMKNARRMLEIPITAAMPCKTSLCRSGELFTDIMKITLQEKGRIHRLTWLLVISMEQHGHAAILDFVDWRNSEPHHEEPDRRILLKERPAPSHQGAQKRRISDITSDHSLSS